jgi:hypothetical protein
MLLDRQKMSSLTEQPISSSLENERKSYIIEYTPHVFAVETDLGMSCNHRSGMNLSASSPHVSLEFVSRASAVAKMLYTLTCIDWLHEALHRCPYLSQCILPGWSPHSFLW